MGVQPRSAADRREPLSRDEAPALSAEREEEIAALRARNAALEARLRELERELVDQATRANAAIAAAQERAYWLDRWQLDLNALMRRRGAAEARAAVRGLRWVARELRRLRRRLRP